MRQGFVVLAIVASIIGVVRGQPAASPSVQTLLPTGPDGTSNVEITRAPVAMTAALPPSPSPPTPTSPDAAAPKKMPKKKKGKKLSPKTGMEMLSKESMKMMMSPKTPKSPKSPKALPSGSSSSDALPASSSKMGKKKSSDMTKLRY